MFVMVVAKFRQRVMQFVRIILISVLLALLISQMFNMFISRNMTSGWFKEQKPTGNPMRVENKAKVQMLKQDPSEDFTKSLNNYFFGN